MLRNKRNQLSGLEKAAILMNVLGEERSFAMMKEIKDSDLRKLLNVMGHMKKAPIALINSVLREFLYKISEREEIIFDDTMTQPDVVSKGLGEERAKQIFGSLKKVNLIDRKNLSVLDEVDIKTLVEFLVDEHPQTIALVVAHLSLTKQLSIIRSFPDSIRTEVILRMASLDYVSPDKVDELDNILRTELLGLGKSQKDQFGGVSTVAELINNLDQKTMTTIMTRLDDKDPILAEEIRQHMFTFTDLSKIDDRGIQLILREVPNERLLLALKSAPEELKEKLYNAMSERASEMLRDDLNALGPQKVSEVETAQREIVKIVRRLEEEGKIVIGIGDEADIIP
jgi:flagellar motor switch protein FliG